MNYRHKQLTIWLSLTVLTVVCAIKLSRKPLPVTPLAEVTPHSFPYFFVDYDLSKNSKKFTTLEFQCFGQQENFMCNPVGSTTKKASNLLNAYHTVYSKMDPRIDEESFNKVRTVLSRYKDALARRLKDSSATSTFYPTIQMLYSTSKSKAKPTSKAVYDFIVKKHDSKLIPEGHYFEFLGFEFPVSKRAELKIKRIDLELPYGTEYFEELLDDDSFSYKQLSRYEKRARQVVFYNKYGNLIMHDNKIRRKEFIGFQLTVKIPYIINPETEVFLHNLLTQKLQLSPTTGKIEFLKDRFNEFRDHFTDETEEIKKKHTSFVSKIYSIAKTFILARIFSWWRYYRRFRKALKHIL